jgi:hypothetical protein
VSAGTTEDLLAKLQLTHSGSSPVLSRTTSRSPHRLSAPSSTPLRRPGRLGAFTDAELEELVKDYVCGSSRRRHFDFVTSRAATVPAHEFLSAHTRPA